MELQSLVYIAIATRRSLIIPNLLGNTVLAGIQPRFRTGVYNYFDLLNIHTPTGVTSTTSDMESIGNSISIHSTGLSSYWSERVTGAQYRHRNTNMELDRDKQASDSGMGSGTHSGLGLGSGTGTGINEYIALWPGFRVLYVDPKANLPLQVLEPGEIHVYIGAYIYTYIHIFIYI